MNLRTFFRSRKYAGKYAKLVGGKGSLGDIEVISVEFCSICNLNCRYCFLAKKERPLFLDTGIYENLLSEICENKEYRIKIMEWPISGCFFLHPEYKKIIEITKGYKGRYPGFRPWIILNDNMMLFDKDTVDFIAGQSVINQVICSIDGVDQETFEYMRGNADFNKVLENTGYLLRKNGKSKNKMVIQINNGRDARCLGRKLDRRLKDIFNHADLVTNWEPRDWNESFHNQRPCYAPYPSFCSFVFESVSISTSGAVTKCCLDLKEATKYGDFTNSTLESIWFSEERLSFLRMMHDKNRRLIPGCSSCSINYVSRNKPAFS